MSTLVSRIVFLPRTPAEPIGLGEDGSQSEAAEEKEGKWKERWDWQSKIGLNAYNIVYMLLLFFFRFRKIDSEISTFCTSCEYLGNGIMLK